MSNGERTISRVVLVGHCGMDAGMLRHAVSQALPDVEIAQADRASELDRLADASSLLLVNRVLPGGLKASNGVELIEKLQSQDADHRPATMLISNFPDAQQEARAAGALPGFGKSDLGQVETTEKLQAAAQSPAAKTE